MSKHFRLATFTMVVVALLAAPGCEDSDVTAPTDGILNLVVSPSTLTIDPDSGQDTAASQVIASVFDNAGTPLQNVSVLFSTAGGTLASNGTPVKTNASGVAIDTLTVTASDPATFKVRAQSSAIITDADVTVQVLSGNQPPLASILETPPGSAQVGEIVTFDGSTSVDPDGDGQITCYQWSILSSLGTTEIVQGPIGAAGQIQRQYTVEQTLTVVLRVSDRGDAGALCVTGGAPVPETLMNGTPDTIPQYVIVCANDPPVADAGPDQTLFFPANTFPSQQVILDGTNSSDPDGRIDRYQWNCGNGLPATTLSPGVASCFYQGFGEWTATLTVFDDGNGPPSGGTFPCQKSSEDDTIVRFLEQGTTP